MRISPRSRFASAAFVVIFALSPVFAASVVEYRASAETARGIIFEMLRETATGTVSDAGAKFDVQKLRKVRELLPKDQKVETPHGTQEVSNAWLHARLNDLATEDDLYKRAVILTDIEERLSAIVWKLDELLSAENAGPSKDEDKQRLDEILRREEFQKPSNDEESRFQRWLREFLEWLQGFLPTPGPVTNKEVSGMPAVAWWLQFLIIGIAVALIGYGIYRFGPALIPSLRREKKDRPEDRVILGERVGHDQTATDVFAEAEQLARDGDVRGAIRKGYIALLCELSDRKLIGLARHKTNRDYLRDVRKRKDIYDDVRALTGSFERNWYGKKPSGAADWERFRSEYREAIERI